jgi:hypothetical protein
LLKQIEIMTTQEIYTLANETTEAQLNNLVNGFNTKEESVFNSLVKMGDSKELALWTVIVEKYNAVEVSEMYNIAYLS